MKSTRFYATRETKLPTLQAVARRLTDQAFQQVKAYLEGLATFEETTQRWNELQEDSKAIGYELRLQQGAKSKSLLVTSHKMAARPFTLTTSFCHVCHQSSQMAFCQLAWCQHCLAAFLREAFGLRR